MDQVLPAAGIELPVVWNDLGKRMAEAGVIDRTKMEALYAERGGLNAEAKAWLDGEQNGRLRINQENAGFLLNLLWGFGLGNANPILTEGPMQDPQYGGADRFASTSGWTLATGNTMDHYGKHAFVPLTPDQQARVEAVSKNIYRPCCNNSTYFPDCNHGMAMLGLLELMAAQGVSEAGMYKAALQVNAYWFPSTYVTLAKYFKEKGQEWSQTDAQTLLSASYSSASGYRRILTEVQPASVQGGGGCTV